MVVIGITSKQPPPNVYIEACERCMETYGTFFLITDKV